MKGIIHPFGNEQLAPSGRSPDNGRLFRLSCRPMGPTAVFSTSELNEVNSQASGLFHRGNECRDEHIRLVRAQSVILCPTASFSFGVAASEAVFRYLRNTLLVRKDI